MRVQLKKAKKSSFALYLLIFFSSQRNYLQAHKNTILIIVVPASSPDKVPDNKETD